MQLYDRNNSAVMIVAAIAIVIATVLISSPVIAIAFLGCGRNFNAYFSKSSKQSYELIESSDYYPFISQE